MSQIIPTAADFVSELSFSTSRSGGPGGQNVNKVNSKVTLKWDIETSQLLNEVQKETLLKKLATSLTKEGVLLVQGQESRSQLQNREDVMMKLDQILLKALTPVKKRKPTKPGKAAKQKRIQNKKQNSEKKNWRKRVE